MAAKEVSSRLLILLLAGMTVWIEADLASFKEEYVDYDEHVTSYGGDYCNDIMKEKGLKQQSWHMFIHAPMEDIIDVCTEKGGIPTRYRFRISKERFPVTLCSTGNDPIRGVYSGYRNYDSNETIYIECENGLPSKLVGAGIISG